jgi:hypothetical protein
MDSVFDHHYVVLTLSRRCFFLERVKSLLAFAGTAASFIILQVLD